MSDSHLTEDEITMLQLSELPRGAPYVIQGVSHGMFSIARHYGGAKFQGYGYTYTPATDELVRDDVVKWLKRRRKPKAKPPKSHPNEPLFGKPSNPSPTTGWTHGSAWRRRAQP